MSNVFIFILAGVPQSLNGIGSHWMNVRQTATINVKTILKLIFFLTKLLLKFNKKIFKSYNKMYPKFIYLSSQLETAIFTCWKKLMMNKGIFIYMFCASVYLCQMFLFDTDLNFESFKFCWINCVLNHNSKIVIQY